MPQGLKKHRIAMVLSADKVQNMRVRTKTLALQSNAPSGQPNLEAGGL